MATSFGALCTDFYINHKLALKMDLPTERETVLHFFDGVRKGVPAMNRFRRYEAELVLESSRRELEYQWLSQRRNSLRTGHANPDTMEKAYQFHRLVLQLAPYHLSISPLDVDYLELMLGFDLECKADHDEVVFDALFADSPFAKLAKVKQSKILDLQPALGLTLSDGGEMQAYFEVKTRRKTRRGGSARFKNEPISIFLSVRKYGPIDNLDALQSVFGEVAAKAERLASDRLVPDLLTPISRQIMYNR